MSFGLVDILITYIENKKFSEIFLSGFFIFTDISNNFNFRCLDFTLLVNLHNLILLYRNISVG